MTGNYIDFISAYCDRWCERCPFTSRCSLFAVEAATAMCGDFAEGLELAIGMPRPEPGEPEEEAMSDDDFDFANQEMTAEEVAESIRQEEARDRRVGASPIATLSMTYGLVVHGWLSDHGDPQHTNDPVLSEAFEIVAHDSGLIAAKLARALHGHDRRIYDHDDVEHSRVQNDWNGSAKMALILIGRSETAWRAIATATRSQIAVSFADQLSDLQDLVEEKFPDAWRFIRPGFDEGKYER
jgi:hypothetical protein